MPKCGEMCMFFWSEMIAKTEGGRVQALCLNPKSPHFSKYTFGHQGCEFGEVGMPIDDPTRPEYRLPRGLPLDAPWSARATRAEYLRLFSILLDELP